MKRIAIALFAVVMSVGLMPADAEAKRFGGARSSGMSRDSSVMKRDAVPAKPAPTQAATAPATAPKPGMSRWLGPIAGLAAGLGLAALFSHLGMGEGMANMVMILLLVMAGVFVFRWLMRKRQTNAGPQPAMQYSGAPSGLTTPRPAEVFTPAPSGAQGAVASAPEAHVPADFDVEGFLRQAKLNFIRLQAANDRGDMDDMRQFCAPEMVAEIQMQLQERGQATQQTDVVQLNAELLDVTQEDHHMLASVRFSGLIREEAGAAPENFAEVWHLTKPADGSRGWCIAGIQQN